MPNDANEIIVNFTIEEESQIVKMGLEEDDATLMSLETGIPVGGVQEYPRLKKLPSINGETLITNYDEIDPTVPEWAKGNEPQPINTVDIEFIWKSIFND